MEHFKSVELTRNQEHISHTFGEFELSTVDYISGDQQEGSLVLAKRHDEINGTSATVFIVARPESVCGVSGRLVGTCVNIPLSFRQGEAGDCRRRDSNPLDAFAI